jgi:predicted RNA-binding protein with PUA-like domain
MTKNYWLLKSEPTTWSFDQQEKSIITMWDGVRNYQAANHLKAMKMGDLCFFYHSNIGKEIVGLVKVVKEAYPDPTDESGRFVAIDVAFEKKFIHPISLAAIKHDDRLKHLPLITQSRLSVMPIDPNSFEIICGFGMGKTI